MRVKGAPPLQHREDARLRGCADREQAGSGRGLWKGLGASRAGDQRGLEANYEAQQGSASPPPRVRQKMGVRQHLQPERMRPTKELVWCAAGHLATRGSLGWGAPAGEKPVLGEGWLQVDG